MKINIIRWSTLLLTITACQKTISPLIESISPAAEIVQSKVDFIEYSIKKGEQYCDKNVFKEVDYKELSFVVKFDSSAIYTTVLPENQLDINKLLGFSDNNAQHHEYSARFGWRWSDNALRLFGYIYNDSLRSSLEIGTVNINSENHCSIKVAGEQYIFTLNNKTFSMPRKAQTATGIGYKLYPYFGGDELAPHDINIWIKEL